jgi:hypothetical protein
MPLQKIQMRPGVNREGTSYTNEGGYYESEKVRFRSGLPEKIGGWQSIVLPLITAFKGVARAMTNWVPTTGENLLGIGTSQKVYVEYSGGYNDITPLTTASPVTINNNPITTVSGSLLVTITDTAHGASIGTFVTFSGAAAVGGLTIVGEYEIIEVLGTGSYTIASTTVASSSASGGGASVVVNYQINAGLASFVSGYGWGTGTWSRGTWGSSATTGSSAQIRLWSLDNYGNDMVFAPRNGPIYYWAKDTSTFARGVLLSGLSTAAGYAGTYVPTQTLQIMTSDIQRFAIAFGANPYTPGDPNTTFDPMIVRWADQEQIYEWVPAPDNQAGELRLSNGSSIVCGIHTKQEILVFTDSSLYSMQYIGPPFVWGFSLLGSNISIASQSAAATASNVTYWMGVDKFYMYSGRVETLPCTLKQYVFGDINKAQLAQIVSGTNEGFNEVWWQYPSADSSSNDRYVIYNYLENIWYYGTLCRSAWLDSPLRDYPMAVYSVQNTHLSVAAGSSDVVLFVLDNSSFPASGTITIEAEQITYTGITGDSFTGCTRGANSSVAASHLAYRPVTNNTSNQVLYHEVGTNENMTNVEVPIAAYIQSSDFDIGDGHNFGFVWRVLPDLTFAGSSATSPTVTLTLRPRINSGTAYGTPSSPSVVRTSSYPVEQYTGQVYTRLRGRQMAFKISSSALGVAWQLGAPRIDVRQDGRA